MVRKSGKYGVRSGNTLRASNSRYNRQYHSESCIVRKSANLSRRQSSQVADDSLLDADGVIYSLNKKGRWGLPSMIKENIRHEEIDVKISISQRHKISRTSNCVDFCCNKGNVKSVVTSHGYFNDSSVRNGTKGGRRKKRGQAQAGQSQPGEGEEGAIPDPDPEITYDVLYPSPITSSISHNPKYIRNAELIVYDDGEIREAGRIRKKKGKRHRVNLVYDETQSDVEECDSFDDQQSENEETTPSNEVMLPEVMLIDILESAERAKELCSEQSKKRRVKRKKTKPQVLEDEWVVVAGRVEDDEAYSSAEEASLESSSSIHHELPPTPKLESVRIILQCDAVQPHHLQEQFKDRYIEGQCQPRKFIIDTTQTVSDAMKKTKVANLLFIGSLDVSSCLVFSRDANYDQGLDVYQVHFNINSTVESIRIETLFDLMPVSVEEVVHAAASYATILPPDSFQKLESSEVAQCSQKLMAFQLVPCVNKWTASSVPLHHVADDEPSEFDIISREEAFGAAAAVAVENLEEEESKRPEYCNICFEEISPELFTSVSASCLSQCGHWFCDGCWKEHISEKINSGALKLKCPEYKCNSKIDTATLLSLAGIKHVNLHQKLKNTMDVDKSPNLKWCPNPKCSRVLKGKDSVTVNCQCGKVVCFTCLKDAHWPATCEQTTHYTKKLRKYGDDDNDVFEDEAAIKVRGKSCPQCKRYIEKNGGCKYMLCVCGYQFCWACLGAWLSHTSYVSCQRKSDSYRTTSILVKHVDSTVKSLKSAMYKMAVAHRTLRRPQNVRSLKSTVNSLSLQLRGFMSKGVDIGEHSIASGDSSPVSTTAVHNFLVQMMQLKLELNHVIEHTAVLLDERQIQYGSRKLGHICNRLEWICSSIEANLVSKGREELLRAVPRLCYLRPLARRGVSALVTALSDVESQTKSYTE